MRKFRMQVRWLLQRRRAEQELSAEYQFHVDQLTDGYVADGMTPPDARAAALRAMEGMEQHKEASRDVRGMAWLENLWRDSSYALRMMRKSKVFTAVAILSLALGIGANAAIFSLINTLLLRPLPVPHPERLRIIYLETGRPRPQYAHTYTEVQSFRAHGQEFSQIFAFSGHMFQMKSGAEMVHVSGAVASGDYFSGLGVAPIAGRTFTATDDSPSGGKDGPVAVISDRFWERQFQRRATAVGSSLTLDRIPFTVIGVMPQSFFGANMDEQPDIWVPLRMSSRIDSPKCIESRSCWWLVSMGRMKDGVSAQQADASLKVATPAILREALPDWNQAGQKRFLSYKVGSTSGEHGWSGLRLQFSNPLAILMTLVGLVLLIACANMANLLLARAMARHREIGVRLAMGAGRGRIIRQLLTESALLSLMGGAVGTLFAFWLTGFLAAFVQGSGRGDANTVRLDLQPDWRVVLFTLTVALGTGMLFGLAPALRATRLGIGSSLKESARSVRGAGRMSVGRFTLALQAALSVVLVAAAGLFAGSLYQLLTLNVGFSAKKLTMVSIDTNKRPEKGAALGSLYGRLLEKVNGLPGVKVASLLWMIPLSNGGWDNDLSVPGSPKLPEKERDTAANAIGPRFFDTMQIPLLAGRQFNEADTVAAEKVAVIDQLAAKRFFPDRNPIGLQVLFGGTLMRVVGIAGTIRYWNLRDEVQPEIYVPYTQMNDGIPSLTFVVRTDMSVASLNSEFRSALQSVASDVPVGRVRTMEEQVDDSVGSERMMASLSLFFGVLALLLTAIGLHGILAYAVTRRKGEIGIRMALGAQGGDVVWLVVSETAGLVAAGIAVGVVAVLGLSKLAASLLYGIRPNDPGNLILSVVVLVGVAVVAAMVPAMRAARLDPTIALREE